VNGSDGDAAEANHVAASGLTPQETADHLTPGAFMTPRRTPRL